MHRRPARLAVIGAANWDTTIFEDTFAVPGEEVEVRKVQGFPGGKGANTAVAAARILGRGAVSFVGTVGADEFHLTLRRSLEAEGVDPRGLLAVRGRRSGRAFVVVDRTGSKMIHTLFGANEAMSPRHLKAPGASRALSSSAGVVIMDVPLPVALAAAEAAKKNGSQVFYSPGVRCKGSRLLLDRVIGLANYLVVDRVELSRLRPNSGPREAAVELQRRGSHLVVVATLGGSGCIVAEEGAARAIPPVDLRSLGLRAVNSTGSGDAFLGAFACYSLAGLAPAEAARWGNLAGALKAASEETRGSPTRKELESRMAEITGAGPLTRG